MSLPDPDIDFVLEGLRHRKWVFPAREYTLPGWGVAGERWVYAVGETPLVVTFTLLTGRYPEGCDTLVPCALAVSAHRAGDGDPPCVYLDGPGCGNDGSGIDAEEWYAAAQGGDEDVLVPDDTVFAHVRDLYAAWSI